MDITFLDRRLGDGVARMKLLLFFVEGKLLVRNLLSALRGLVLMPFSAGFLQADLN